METEEMNIGRRAARIVSWVLHPFLLPLYLVAMLLTMTTFVYLPQEAKLYLAWVVALYALVLPLLALGILRRVGWISDFRLDDRRERILPLLVGTICYLVCALTLLRIPTVDFLRKMMVAAACCEAMCLAVSLRWKISLHLTGMGAAVALLVVLNIVGAQLMFVPLLVAVAASGALASSRLYLGSHNGFQILAGFCGGAVVTTCALLWL